MQRMMTDDEFLAWYAEHPIAGAQDGDEALRQWVLQQMGMGDEEAAGSGELTLGADGLWRYADGQIASKWIQDYMNGASASGGGDGGGVGGSPLGWAELAYRKERDRVENALGALELMLGLQSREDERAARRQQAIADAAPYAVHPGMAYYPGFAPTDPAAKAGLVSPRRVWGTPFEPDAARNNPYDDPVQKRVDDYLAMIGLA